MKNVTQASEGRLLQAHGCAVLRDLNLGELKDCFLRRIPSEKECLDLSQVLFEFEWIGVKLAAHSPDAWEFGAFECD